MSDVLTKVFGSVSAAGILTAIVCGICYWLNLIIFTPRDLAWIVFYGLIAFALGLFFALMINIWGQ